MTHDEALKLALEALKIECRMYEATDPETGAPYNMIEAITAIKKALAQPDPYKQGYTDAMNWKVQNHLEHLPTAQPEQEPVAWATQMGEYAHIKWGAKRPEYPMVYEIPLYTTPPQRTWVGLTDEEVDECYYWKDCQWTTDELVRHVEAKLKEKNT